MKIRIILPFALLFSLVSCSTTRQQTSFVEDIQTMVSDSTSVSADSIHAAKTAADSTTLSAALLSQHAEHTTVIEIDTSRTVIVTEFGEDGLPVRQTETRQNYVERQQSWSVAERLQIDAYIEQVRRLNEQYDEFRRQMETYRMEFDSKASKQEYRREPVTIPWYAKWTLIAEAVLLGVFMLALSFIVYRQRKHII